MNFDRWRQNEQRLRQNVYTPQLVAAFQEAARRKGQWEQWRTSQQYQHDLDQAILQQRFALDRIGAAGDERRKDALLDTATQAKTGSDIANRTLGNLKKLAPEVFGGIDNVGSPDELNVLVKTALDQQKQQREKKWVAHLIDLLPADQQPAYQGVTTRTQWGDVYDMVHSQGSDGPNLSGLPAEVRNSVGGLSPEKQSQLVLAYDEDALKRLGVPKEDWPALQSAVLNKVLTGSAFTVGSLPPTVAMTAVMKQWNAYTSFEQPPPKGWEKWTMAQQMDYAAKVVRSAAEAVGDGGGAPDVNAAPNPAPAPQGGPASTDVPALRGPHGPGRATPIQVRNVVTIWKTNHGGQKPSAEEVERILNSNGLTGIYTLQG